jgi:hypothetical protein
MKKVLLTVICFERQLNNSHEVLKEFSYVEDIQTKDKSIVTFVRC